MAKRANKSIVAGREGKKKKERGRGKGEGERARRDRGRGGGKGGQRRMEGEGMGGAIARKSYQISILNKCGYRTNSYS